MRITILFALVVFLGFQAQAQSSTFTNLVIPASSATPRPQVSLSIKAGQLARIVSYYNSCCGNELTVSIGTNSWPFQSVIGSQVVGPATITLTAATVGPMLLGIELVTPSEPFTPSNAVVIPADSGGPVNIILESSTDMITWTAALPGTYGTSTEKRFFRVRAERAP